MAPIRLPVSPNLTVPTRVAVSDGCSPEVTSGTVSPSWYPPVAADLSSITTSSGPAGARPLLMLTIGVPSDAGASLKLPPMPGAPPPLPRTLPSVPMM